MVVRRGACAFALFVAFGLLLLGAEGTQAEAPATGSAVIFSGTPSELVIKTGLLSGERLPACSVFDVRVTALNGRAYLTTRSFGDARLAHAGNGECPPPADPRWASLLDLGSETGTHRVAIRLASERSRADERTGEIVAFGDAGEIAVARVIVRREPAMRLWPEVKWFVGFILPALVAYLIAQRAARSTERRKERNSLAVFRTAEKAKVDALVRDVRTALTGSRIQNGGAQVLQSLRTQEIIPALPIDDAEKLVHLCEQNDMDGIVQLLRRLFPHHADQLVKPATGRVSRAAATE